MKRQQEDGHPQAKERGPEEINPASTLILDFQPPELWENTFPLFKLPSLWYFVMADQANSYMIPKTISFMPSGWQDLGQLEVDPHLTLTICEAGSITHFYKVGNQGSEKVNSLPRITELLSDGAWIQIQVLVTPQFVLCVTLLSTVMCFTHILITKWLTGLAHLLLPWWCRVNWSFIYEFTAIDCVVT